MKIAVLGAAGFVGSGIRKAIEEDGRHDVIPITREDRAEDLIEPADVVVHAANPAGRYRAECAPERDFEETVVKTDRILSLCGDKRVILISSISCRTQLDTVYGRHRKACELLAGQRGARVLRLGPMYGGRRTQDTLHDILQNRPVYVARETRYAYADVDVVGRMIVDRLDRGEAILELGAANCICLGELAEKVGSSSTFQGKDDTQIPVDTGQDYPDARDVYMYIEKTGR